MGKKQTADGRWIIGGGENSTDYKGFLHWRECYICLTESGATEESVNYLNALKEYALAHYALGEPIMPPSMTVWVVANGKAVAVQADDVKIEDGDYTICGITYSDGAWDYSNAGKGGGGSSLPAVTAEDNGDVLTVVDGEWGKGDAPYTVGESMATVLAQQTLTTSSYQGTNVAQIPGSFDISVGTTYKVTYNGTAYDVTAQDMSGNVYLGEFSGQPDYTNYPFFILVAQAEGMIVYSSTANPTLKIEVGTKTVVPSDDFKAAVAASGVGGDILVATMTYDSVADDGSYLIDKTYDEICSAMNKKTPIYIWCDDYGNAVMETKPPIPNGNVYFSFFNIASMGGNPATYALLVARFALSSSGTLTLTEYLADVEED